MYNELRNFHMPFVEYHIPAELTVACFGMAMADVFPIELNDENQTPEGEEVSRYSDGLSSVYE